MTLSLSKDLKAHTFARRMLPGCQVISTFSGGRRAQGKAGQTQGLRFWKYQKKSLFYLEPKVVFLPNSGAATLSAVVPSALRVLQPPFPYGPTRVQV